MCSDNKMSYGFTYWGYGPETVLQPKGTATFENGDSDEITFNR